MVTFIHKRITPDTQAHQIGDNRISLFSEAKRIKQMIVSSLTQSIMDTQAHQTYDISKYQKCCQMQNVSKTLNNFTYHQNMFNSDTQAHQIYNILYVDLLSDAKRIDQMYTQMYHHNNKPSKISHTKIFLSNHLLCTITYISKNANQPQYALILTHCSLYSYLLDY